MEKTQIRQRAIQFLPMEPETVAAQTELLGMLSAIVPSIQLCLNKAERDYWPAVESGTLPVQKAIRGCAHDVDNILRITKPETMKLENQTEETLLGAWCALDYYGSALQDTGAAEIQKLQDILADRLVQIAPQTPEVGATVPLNAEEVKQAELLMMQQIMKEEEEEQEQKTQALEVIPQTTKSTEIVQDSIPVREVEVINTGTTHRTGSRTSNKKKILPAVIAIAAVVVMLILMPMLNKVRAVEKAIEAIGTVELTDTSREAIENAERMYEELPEKKQDKVENYGVLVEAREEYDHLVVEAAIDAIGTVTMESGADIENAELLYKELPSAKQKQVGNAKTLVAARKEYDRLCAAVKKAQDAIDAIGTVTLQSEQAIIEARRAYSALEKDNLTGYLADRENVLLKAEKDYGQCVSDDLLKTANELKLNKKYDDAIEVYDQICKKWSATTNVQAAKQGIFECKLIQAEAVFKQNKLYETMNIVKTIDSSFHSTTEYKDFYTKLTNKLEKNRPTNGKTIAGSITSGYCYVTITAGSEDICVKMQDTSNAKTYKMVYIRANESKKINAKNGTYVLKIASGKYWYDKTHMFGDDTFYGKNYQTLTFSTYRSGSYIYYRTFKVTLSRSSVTSISASQY